ncbi:YitT family protein [Alkalicoccobacillus plakortidis]|uniref:YitT family protein n=1 Tax=Alkalicoccobacillus plakortidis TaxID=444060 RepID=A0ABT0XL12_9BACI|nr:YitT family protein [Alkalicoccobacillus plakortidis]MCM2676522.1 YitT family protein [Alkalicoccobacillus plakortidis]
MKRWTLIFIGCLLAAFGVVILKHSDLVTGGTAGLSLSIAYLSHLPFSFVFFLINIPFYLFSMLRMGLSFTVTTMLSVTMLSLLTGIDTWLPAFSIPYWAGAIAGGFVIGIGLSLLFKNSASLGGSNILALFLQKRYGFDPGKTNFVFDLMVVLTSLYTIGFIKGFFSVLSIAVTSRVISYYKNGYATKKPAVKKEFVLTRQASLSK